MVSRHSFVVRLWREEGQHTWLGSIRHVSSGAEVCVTNPDELVTFIEQWTGPSLPPTAADLERPEQTPTRLK